MMWRIFSCLLPSTYLFSWGKVFDPFFLIGLVSFFFFFLFLAIPVASGSSWARGQIRAASVASQQPWKYQIETTSATYCTAWGNGGSLTNWVRPGIEPTSSWRQCWVLNLWAMMGIPGLLSNCWVLRVLHILYNNILI